jgi:hypothetical protein
MLPQKVWAFVAKLAKESAVEDALVPACYTVNPFLKAARLLHKPRIQV